MCIRIVLQTTTSLLSTHHRNGTHRSGVRDTPTSDISALNRSFSPSPFGSGVMIIVNITDNKMTMTVMLMMIFCSNHDCVDGMRFVRILPGFEMSVSVIYHARMDVVWTMVIDDV